MTPFECARSLADYLKQCFDAYEESADVTGKQEQDPIHVYAGFLPRAGNRVDMLKICPAIVLRPDLVDDRKQDTRVSLVLYATVYDDDMERGCESLYHLLEFVRYCLLSQNPIRNKWQIVDDAMNTSIPDGQPFPQWIGTIEFEVYLPQPTWTSPNVMGVTTWQGKENRFP